MRERPVEDLVGNLARVLGSLVQLVLCQLLVALVLDHRVGSIATQSPVLPRIHIVRKVTDLTRGVLLVVEEGRGGKGDDSVVVPQVVQQPLVHRRLEVGNVERVVGLAVHAKVLDLAERDRLVLARLLVRQRRPSCMCGMRRDSPGEETKKNA